MKPETSQLRDTQRRYLEIVAVSLRPNTVLNSRTAINAIIGYLGLKHPEVSCFSQIERSHIEGWLKHLASRRLRINTRRNFTIKVRVFLETIQAWGWADAPHLCLFRRGDMPPEDRSLPKPLSKETDDALKQELRRRGGLIHKALLFLRATGLRAQELLDLKVHSLRQLPGNDWQLHVPVGKLHSDRVIPVAAATATLFEEIRELRGEILPVRDPETGKPEHFLLARRRGRFSRDALRYHLGRIERALGLKEHPTPHRLRHTFATEMLRAGMKLPVLMKLLGHRSIGMTLCYAEVTGVDVQRAYAEALAKIEGRYTIPALPLPARTDSQLDEKLSARDKTISQLRYLAVTLEAYRRDHATTPKKRKSLQRIVERARRLASDFNDAAS